MKASRSGWTPVACKLAVFLMLMGAMTGCAPQLIIALVKDPALQQSPTFVKFQIGERPTVPEVVEFGPFDTNAIPDEQFAPVEPGIEFFVDVIGCPDGDPVNCVDAASFNARGCTPYITMGRDEADRTVTITVKGALEGDAECPPPP